MELPIITEANRCLNCKTPACQQGCPIHTPIPQIIQLFKAGQTDLAGKLLFENNPLSAVCAKVCDHESQCAGHCVLGKKGNPVRFFEIERYLSETYLDRMVLTAPAVKKHTIAIIGCGPAGMTAAIHLAQKGCAVTIFEWKSKPGGLLQYGIPEFRLSKSVLQQYQTRMEELGIQIRTNTTIGAVLMIDDLFRDGYEAVLIATGAEKPRNLDIQGESLGNVRFGLNYLANPQNLGETIAVIGMGNAAMDVARTAFRNGAQRVMLFGRDPIVNASAHETTYARLDGAEFIFGKQVKKITPQGPVFVNCTIDESGKVTEEAGTETLYPADATIISISQVPRKKLLRTTEGLNATANGTVLVDAQEMTTRPGVFAAGDVVTGSKTVVHAVESAKRAADAMLEYLENRG